MLFAGWLAGLLLDCQGRTTMAVYFQCVNLPQWLLVSFDAFRLEALFLLWLDFALV